jgi:hypothetical protein
MMPTATNGVDESHFSTGNTIGGLAVPCEGRKRSAGGLHGVVAVIGGGGRG